MKPRHRHRATLVATIAAAVALVGCSPDAPEDPGTTGAEPTTSEGDATAAESAGDTETTEESAVASAETIAVPDGGPAGLTEFPVPAGVEVYDYGDPMGGSWQFDVLTADTQAVVDFYREELPGLGYEVEQNVEVGVGENVIVQDLMFEGDGVYGSVYVSDGGGSALVSLDDEPLGD